MKKRFLFGVILSAILLLLLPGSMAQPIENPWNGTWGDGDITLFMQQDGTMVHGMYQPNDANTYDPGVIEGNLSEDGTGLTGRWFESGVSTWALSDDKMSFKATGMTSPIEGLYDQSQYDYNGTRVGEMQDPENPLTGEWLTDWKLNTMTQNGTSVTGVNHPLPGVDDDDGSIEGTVSDSVVQMNWTEMGDFSFKLADDGSLFNGTYTRDLGASNETLYWNMTKIQ